MLLNGNGSWNVTERVKTAVMIPLAFIKPSTNFDLPQNSDDLMKGLDKEHGIDDVDVVPLPKVKSIKMEVSYEKKEETKDNSAFEESSESPDEEAEFNDLISGH